jgi:Flp pilus assembly protein TadD
MRQMGLANSEFVNGNYQEAIAILTDLIRYNPDAAEPYQTLAMIHEDEGDIEKALLLYIVTAQLKTRDIDTWRRITNLAM